MCVLAAESASQSTEQVTGDPPADGRTHAEAGNARVAVKQKGASRRGGSMAMLVRPRLLIADPDAGICRLLSRHYSANNYAVISGRTACDVIKLIKRVPPDLAILSTDLEDLSGLDCIRRVQDLTQAPIVALRRPGRGLTTAEILDAGAGDCLDVPFSLTELDARCRRQLRSADVWPLPGVLTTELGRVEVDPLNHTVRVGGKPVSVTQREFALLVAIAGAAGRKLTREAVLLKVWGTGFNGDARKLRRKVAALRGRVGDLADALRTLIDD